MHVEKWESSSTAKRRKVAREPEAKKSKLSFPFSLACFAHFSSCFSWWILDFVQFLFLVCEMTFPANFKGGLCHETFRGGSILCFIGKTALTRAWVKSETVNFFGGQNLSLFLRELPRLKRIIRVCRFVGFSWILPKCSSGISVQNCVRPRRNSKYFSPYVPESDNNQNNFWGPTSEKIFSGSSRIIWKAPHTLLDYYLILSSLFRGPR